MFAVVLAGLVCCSLASVQKSASTFPSFELRASDGKTYSLSTLAKGKPVFFVFLREDEMLSRGVADMNRLSRLLKGKVRIVGLNPLAASEVRAFVKDHGIKFLVLSESATLLSVIGSKNGTNVLTTAVVLPRGVLLAQANGYSKQTLTDMLSKVRRATGREISAKLTGFPAKLFFGQTMSFGLVPP